MERPKLPGLTPTTAKYLRYLVSFVVTFGVGTSPLWGGGVIPGFTSILDMFPQDLRDVIPWVSLLMSVPAVAVQFFSTDRRQPRRLRRAFGGALLALTVLILTTYVVYKVFVIRIYIPAADTKVAYLVGANPRPNCECAKRGLEIRECIGFAISVNPDDVSACFPRQEIAVRSAVLSVLYMLLMMSLGVLIGLLILKETFVSLRGPVRAARAAR